MTAGQVGYRARRDLNARSAFKSDVCWVRTVKISSSSAFSLGFQVTGP